MSSKTVKKKAHSIPGKKIDVEKPINFRNIVINFSEFSKSEKLGHIYFGDEKIPFQERHHIYQSIIRKEFTNTVKEFIKVKSLKKTIG